MRSIKVHFLGAAGMVTGSRTFVSYGTDNFLVDCGLFQGNSELRERNWQEFGVSPGSIQNVFLTHAHLDHSGFLPRLVRGGYRGDVIASEGTHDLCSLLIADAAHLEEELANYANRTGYSRHKPAKPLFTIDDAQSALKRFRPVKRNQWTQLNENISYKFCRAGHIIGASFIQFRFDTWANGPITITFSGDLGNAYSKLMKPPENLPETDILVMESTYGDKLHERNGQLVRFAKVIRETVTRGGVVLIPAFAVGRAQEVIYLIKILEDEGEIPKVPVILDSPLASAATRVLLDHPEDHLLKVPFSLDCGVFQPHHFEITADVDESMLSCMREGPMIVLSAAGMLNGGRILHHLKARLPDVKNTLLFVGYQAEGTKGRYLLDHHKSISTLRVHHKEVPLRCQIENLDFLSAHADYQGVLDWIASAPKVPRKIFLNHGTKDAMFQLKDRIEKNLGAEVIPVLTEQDYLIS